MHLESHDHSNVGVSLESSEEVCHKTAEEKQQFM